MSIKKIITAIKTANDILICSHKNPDGDTLGSNFALNIALKNQGKNVISYCEHEPPFEFKFMLTKNFNFTTKLDTIINKNFDIIVIVDCSDRKRLSYFDKIKTLSDTIINIDHHISNENFGDINLVSPEKSATAILIYSIIKKLEIKITTEIAENLYIAIMTDTGSFRYSNTNKETFLIAAELINYGLNAWDISQKIYENKPLKRILLLKEALNNLELSENKKVAIMIIHYETLKKYNASYEDTDGFVNYGRSIAGVEISIFIREEKDGCKLSFRSRGKLDTTQIAKHFGGGGHKNASGAFVNKDLKNVLFKLKNILKEMNL